MKVRDLDVLVAVLGWVKPGYPQVTVATIGWLYVGELHVMVAMVAA